MALPGPSSRAASEAAGGWGVISSPCTVNTPATPAKTPVYHSAPVMSTAAAAAVQRLGRAAAQPAHHRQGLVGGRLLERVPFQQGGVAHEAGVAEAQMLGGFQPAQFVQLAAHKGPQPLAGEVAVGPEQFGHCLSLLSLICCCSIFFARNSWVCTVLGGRRSAREISSTLRSSKKYITDTCK